MALETVLWREASLASDIDAFLTRVGGSVLDAVHVQFVAVRAFDGEHLDTVATIRRGAVGVARPAHPRSELSPAAVVDVIRNLIHHMGEPTCGEQHAPVTAGHHSG